MSSLKRNTGFDIIRTIAIFMVVAIHSHVAPLAANQGSAMWYVVMSLQVICLVAVPLFFMVSGALLLSGEKETDIGTLYKKRIPKQAIPFIVWSLIYVVVRIVMGKIPLSVSAFTSLLYEPAYYQFWFMYTLLAIYLLLPVLQTLLKNCDKKKTEYILILWAVFSVVLPTLSRFVKGFDISEHVDLILCEGYIGYFILGYYLNKYKIDVKKSTAVLMWVLGTVATIVCAIIEYVSTNKLNLSYEGFVYQAYMVPGTVVSATGMFLFLCNLKYKFSEKSKKAVTKIAELSVGVYYIHMLVLTVLEKIGFTGENNILILGGKIIATYIISLIGAFVISKIPVARKILLGAK